MQIEMQLARIIISENDDQQIIVLKETNGQRHFPIVIGRRASSIIYGAFLLLAYLTIIFGVFLHFPAAWYSVYPFQ